MEPATAAPQAASRVSSARTSSAFNSFQGNGKVTRVKRLDKATKVCANIHLLHDDSAGCPSCLLLLSSLPRHHNKRAGCMLCSLQAAASAAHSSAAYLSPTGSTAVLQSYIEGMLRRADHRAWCLRHGKTLPPPRLHPVILKVIREWFDLVDDDGSGTLEHHELMAALQVGGLAGTFPSCFTL
jgi:hypothetical protein